MGSMTTDTFFNGRVRVNQERSGYRFSIDAVLLAYYARPRPGDKIIDLGTGCGIIPVILAHRHHGITLYGIEVQKALAEIATLNAKENRMSDRITIIEKDLKLLEPPDGFRPGESCCQQPSLQKGQVRENKSRPAAGHCKTRNYSHPFRCCAGRLPGVAKFGTAGDDFSGRAHHRYNFPDAILID